MKKLTKQKFCALYPTAKKLRYSDPLQFSVLFNEWKLKKQKHL
jgi:hypothetical protein